MGVHRNSTEQKILRRIGAKGPDWVFTPADFADLGTKNAVGSALKRLKAGSSIRLLARGLYQSAETRNIHGIKIPAVAETQTIAEALGEKEKARLQISGAHAAHELGLTEQVPMKTVYLTDGRTRTVQVGRRRIALKHTTPRNMETAGRISGTVIQALRWLGKEQVTPKVVHNLMRILDDRAKKHLRADARFAPEWIAQKMRAIAGAGAGAESNS